MPPPIRIAHIIGNLERGGAQAVLLEMMRHLDRNRFDPRIVHLKSPNDFQDEIRAKSWDCRKIRATRAYRTGEVLGLSRALSEIAPDIVHTHADFANFAGRAAAIYARIPRIVVHYQNTYEHRFTPRFRALEEMLASRTDAYLACSEGVEGFLARNLDLRGRPVTTLPNCIDTGPVIAAALDRAGARKKLNVPPGVFHLLHTARLEPHKQPGQLLQALRLTAGALGDWRLTLVGGGSLREELEKQLHHDDEEAARTGGERIASRVVLAGWSSEVPTWLATADMFCLVSKNEGLPLSLVEAMAAGVPTVASDIVGPHEVISNGRNGLLVDSSDPQAICDAILRYRKDEPFRHRTAELARERAEDYSLGRYMPKLESFYEELMAAPSLAEQRPAGLLERFFLLRRLRHAGRSQKRTGVSGGVVR